MASVTKRCRHRGAERMRCGCTWYLRRREGGRERFTPLGPDRDVAERALARAAEVSPETVGAAIDAWLAAKEAAPGPRANSLAGYRSRAAHVRAYFGPERVRSLRDEDLTRFVADLLAEGYRPATVRGIYTCLTGVLRHAQRRGVLRALPLPPDGPGIPESAPREHALELAEVEEIIARMPPPWGPLGELVLLTGLRWGEAVAIERADVRGPTLRVRRTANRHRGTNPPKTRAGQRTVPLSARALAILAELDLPVGGSYTRAYAVLREAMGPAHRPGMGWHSLRNAHADLLDLAGVSLREAAARMGHGHHFAQTLAYRLTREAGDADALDTARRHGASDPSPAPGAPVSPAAARARRRPAR